MLLFELEDDVQSIDEQRIKKDVSSTFADNMTMPIHRWYRYTAGFSAAWVRDLINSEKQKGRSHIIDPFAGSGTVLLESEFQQVEAIGIEAHPYIYRVANTKLLWQAPLDLIKDGCQKFLYSARKKKITERQYPKLIAECYPPDILSKLEALRQTWFDLEQEEMIKKFTWFIITLILRVTSPVGTAQWQYVLPNKSKGKVVDPFTAFEAKALELLADMRICQEKYRTPGHAVVFQEDARDIKSVPDMWADLVITSPPYANNYDYADATRLEMTFWGDIQGWSDLQDNVRAYLVRACTQHVSGFGKHIDAVLTNPKLAPIKDELTSIYNQLAEVRLDRGGKKNYHYMIAAYFSDLSEVFHSLRRVTKDGVRMCFVIGDSAPYGVYVPVDRWLGQLAIGAGFKNFEFEKLRDRNIKWKNRKHRVPLQEGRLWING